MKILTTINEAISRENIIKTLKSDTFDAEAALTAFEEKYKTILKEANLPEVPYVRAYVLKALSLFKKSNPASTIMDSKVYFPITAYSYVTKKKIMSSMDEYIQNLFNDFSQLKTYEDMLRWAEKFTINITQTIIQDLQDIQIKSIYKPEVKGPGFSIYQFTKYAEARAIGADTHWCVSSSNGASIIKKYVPKNKLYALILTNAPKDNDKFLLTVPNNLDIIDQIKIDAQKIVIKDIFEKKFTTKNLSTLAVNANIKNLIYNITARLKSTDGIPITDIVLRTAYINPLSVKLYAGLLELFYKEKEYSKIVDYLYIDCTIMFLNYFAKNITALTPNSFFTNLEPPDDLNDSDIITFFKKFISGGDLIPHGSLAIYADKLGLELGMPDAFNYIKDLEEYLTKITKYRTTNSYLASEFITSSEYVKQLKEKYEQTDDVFFEFADKIDNHSVPFVEYINYYSKIPNINKEALEFFGVLQKTLNFPTSIPFKAFLNSYIEQIMINSFIVHLRKWYKNTRETHTVYTQIQESKKELIFFLREFYKTMYDAMKEFLKFNHKTPDILNMRSRIMNRLFINLKFEDLVYKIVSKELPSLTHEEMRIFKDLILNIDVEKYKNMPYTAIIDYFIVQMINKIITDSSKFDFDDDLKALNEQGDRIKKAFNSKLSMLV